jgi:hypothetical protein
MANSTNISEGILAGGGTDARSMTATDLNHDQFFYASIQMLKLRCEFYVSIQIISHKKC